MGFNKDID